MRRKLPAEDRAAGRDLGNTSFGDGVHICVYTNTQLGWLYGFGLWVYTTVRDIPPFMISSIDILMKKLWWWLTLIDPWIWGYPMDPFTILALFGLVFRPALGRGENGKPLDFWMFLGPSPFPTSLDFVFSSIGPSFQIPSGKLWECKRFCGVFTEDITGEPYVCCAGLCPCGPLGEPQEGDHEVGDVGVSENGVIKWQFHWEHEVLTCANHQVWHLRVPMSAIFTEKAALSP